MYQLLIKTFVRDYKNTEDAHVREQYGTVCSIISIVCNIVLVVFKLIFGTLVHSVSIVADGYNNLSDAGSNIATFFALSLRISILMQNIHMVMDVLNILQV